MGTTTTTPSNGEALLTFEQQTIRDLIVLEHQRLDMEERIALGKLASEQKQLALQERFADDRARSSQQTSDQLLAMVTAFAPILASLFPNSEDSSTSGRRRRGAGRTGRRSPPQGEQRVYGAIYAPEAGRPGTVDDLINAIAHHEASANDDGARGEKTDDAPMGKRRAIYG